jgi:hypothetical protein
MLVRLFAVLLVLAALVAAYFWAALSWSYSEGERAGWVQKLSKKGWICKTWEGEMALVSLPGSMSEKFYFTVRDEKVAQEILRLMPDTNRRLALHYEEKVGLPTSCFGETRHFVTRISLPEVAAPAPAPAAAPTPAPAVAVPPPASAAMPAAAPASR